METTLLVTGMRCMNCVKHVEKALQGVDGVAQVKVDLGSGTASIQHDARASLASLVSAVEEEGYTAQSQP
jgi:copper chaperone CopZ